jgi:hypothetical protein
MDAMARAARDAGADVRLGTRVEAIEVPGGELAGVVLGRDGRRERVAVEQAVVAYPPGAAARALVPAAPPAVTRPVRMRAVCLVYLRLPVERLSDEAWIQVADPAVPFARLFEPANWSADLVPGGGTVIGMECYCRAAPDDPVWGLSDEALGRACADALAGPLGPAADPAAAELLEVVRLPAAYPVADIAQVPAARAPAEWLAALGGVHVAPGAAVIEAIESGERAAAAILRRR